VDPTQSEGIMVRGGYSNREEERRDRGRTNRTTKRSNERRNRGRMGARFARSSRQEDQEQWMVLNKTSRASQPYQQREKPEREKTTWQASEEHAQRSTSPFPETLDSSLNISITRISSIKL
jgi:hypothetical protein